MKFNLKSSVDNHQSIVPLEVSRLTFPQVMRQSYNCLGTKKKQSSPLRENIRQEETVILLLFGLNLFQEIENGLFFWVGF
ncbi:hypothetical protein [Gaoshiqia sediminis]|uniref:hypothetical protein n=1 Tax=Gaoshiqia sediminis TaxID=2986998 RepID=UPI0024A67BEA|nr:hypothetical protein [Gaoshiqia sediminis]